MKKKKRLLLVPVLFVLAVAVALGVFANSRLEKVNYEARDTAAQAPAGPEDGTAAEGSVYVENTPEPTKRPSAEELAERDKQERGVENILLIGVDNDRADSMEERGNADGIVLLSVNKDSQKVIMTSLMRDIAVMYPEHYRTKLTMVYHNYGMDAFLDVVESNFDVKIDNYVMLNYLNVIEIVDTMGGLDIELSASEIYGMESKINSLNRLVGDPVGTDVLTREQEGMNHLNGKQVSALMRIRNTGDNDYGRTARIRAVLSGMVKKALTMSLGELTDLADVVMGNITTDMKSTDMMSLMLKAPDYLKYDIVSFRLPIDGTSTTDGSFNFIDFPANIQALRETVYGK